MAGKLATIFDKAAQWTAKQCGKAHTFVAAIAVVILWGVSGPLFGHGDSVLGEVSMDTRMLRRTRGGHS